jgi:hypothetical protein
MSNDSETSLITLLQSGISRSFLPRNDDLDIFEMASSCPILQGVGQLIQTTRLLSMNNATRVVERRRACLIEISRVYKSLLSFQRATPSCPA